MSCRVTTGVDHGRSGVVFVLYCVYSFQVLVRSKADITSVQLIDCFMYGCNGTDFDDSIEKLEDTRRENRHKSDGESDVGIVR